MLIRRQRTLVKNVNCKRAKGNFGNIVNSKGRRGELTMFSDDNYFSSVRQNATKMAWVTEKPREVDTLPASPLIYGEKFMGRRHCIQMSKNLREAYI